MHAFVLEDHPYHSMTIKDILIKIGYTHTFVSTLEQAFKEIGNSDAVYPDFAIIDIEIDDDDRAGIKFAKWLEENHPSIPFFFLTQYDENDRFQIAKESLGIGIDRFLSKEYINDKEAFATHIDKFIQNNLFSESQLMATHAGGFMVPNGSRQYRFLKAQDINYLQTEDRNTSVALIADDPLTIGRHLKPIAQQFTEAFPHFLMLGKQYCINTQKIAGVKPSELRGNHHTLAFSDGATIELNPTEFSDLRKSGLMLQIRPNRS